MRKIWLLFFIVQFNALFAIDTPIFRSGKTGLHTYASSSVLSTGKWVKISIKETGIYRLTYSDLKSMGFSKPENVQIYGYGGWMLTENFSVPKIDDLPRVSVKVIPNDCILFYAKGSIKWKYNVSTGDRFIHENNPYSDLGYYFITESSEATNQMKVSPFDGTFSQEIKTFNDYSIHETDLINIRKAGREFYGENFSYTTSQNFTFNTPGITQDDGFITVNFVAKASANTPVTMKINNGNSATQTMNQSSENNAITFRVVWNEQKKESNTVNITYGATGHAVARLNFIRLNYNRFLNLSGSHVFFRNISAIGVPSKYILSGAGQNVEIWNITNNEQPSRMEAKTSGNDIFYTSNSPSLEEFVAVDISKKDQFPKPTVIGEIKNQNLHALPQTDMVIISHPDFVEQAERIAELHRENDNLRVLVVLTEEIYNEFSSGNPDASAYRWLMKMFYDRGNELGDENELPKYLLLFGDGTFDNKLIMADEWKSRNPANKILTYQAYESLSEATSYVVDDYFGFLDDDEGTTLSSSKLDIGIGRFPVRTVEEAKNVTDKTINYVRNPVHGAWKNKVCFVADDNSQGETDFRHMRQADELACTYMNEGNGKNFLVDKIYLQTFKKQTGASGYTYPEAITKLHDLLKSGVLMVNYTGHGSTNNWAEEAVYTKADIQNIATDKLPLFVTATCDFARFDDFDTSAGEMVLLDPKGGGIALFSTTRVVYSTENSMLNKEFCKYIFSKTETGKRLRLGDIMKLSKRNLTDSNKLSFSLFGDPALTLAYPEYLAKITSVNELNPENNEIAFKAGSTIEIKGEIVHPDGTKSTDFNGISYLSLLDSKEVLIEIDRAPNTLYDQSRVLFSGKDSVRNGDFSFKFVVPKDMSYSMKNGLINLYASDYDNNNEAQGYFDNLVIGGTDNEGMNDNTPPQINYVYLNHPDFKNGDIVNASPLFFAEVEDDTGINISGNGIGHDAIIVIDNSPYNKFVINNYFESEVGNPGKGVFKFNIPRLSAGKHTLTFRAWDVMNNSSSKTIEFEVKQDVSPQIFDLYASPNPAKEVVNFYISHDRPENYLTIQIEVYSLSGQLLWKYSETDYSKTFDAVPIQWDLCTSGGQKLAPGVYVYRATVSSNDSLESSEAKKLIILGQ